MSKETQNEKKKGVGFCSMIIRQVVSAAILFSVIYGMHCSSNTTISGYASAIGRALRYDSDFVQTTKDAAVWLKEKITPAPIQDDDGISFH